MWIDSYCLRECTLPNAKFTVWTLIFLALFWIKRPQFILHYIISVLFPELTRNKKESQSCDKKLDFLDYVEKSVLCFITMQRYTQIVMRRYARCMYLVFVFTMLIHWKWYNIAENSYFGRNRQNGREYRIPCSQKCPNFSREIQVQTQ